MRDMAQRNGGKPAFGPKAPSHTHPERQRLLSDELITTSFMGLQHSYRYSDLSEVSHIEALAVG